jgi:hypothetical protein
VPEDLSAATGMMSVMQQVASSFGVAVTALILRASGALSVATFHHTFFMLGLLTILSGSVFLLLKKEDGESLLHVEH